MCKAMEVDTLNEEYGPVNPVDDATPRYTTKRMHYEQWEAFERGRQYERENNKDVRN